MSDLPFPFHHETIALARAVVERVTVLVAWRMLARRERGTFAALSVAGAASVALMSATNFLLSSDFRWPLLLPAALWLAGLLCYLREGAASPTNHKTSA